MLLYFLPYSFLLLLHSFRFHVLQQKVHLALLLFCFYFMGFSGFCLVCSKVRGLYANSC
jgi:hypothetical protein